MLVSRCEADQHTAAAAAGVLFVLLVAERATIDASSILSTSLSARPKAGRTRSGGGGGVRLDLLVYHSIHSPEPEIVSPTSILQTRGLSALP